MSRGERERERGVTDVPVAAILWPVGRYADDVILTDCVPKALGDWNTLKKLLK